MSSPTLRANTSAPASATATRPTTEHVSRGYARSADAHDERSRFECLRSGIALREGERKPDRPSATGCEDEHDIRTDVGLGDLAQDPRVERSRDPPHATARAMRQRHGDELTCA